MNQEPTYEQLYRRVKELERDIKREAIKKRDLKPLLTALVKSQIKFIQGHDRHHVFSGLLNAILEYTSSEFGYIGEVYFENDGTPYQLSRAISNISWDEESRRYYRKNWRDGLRFESGHTLHGIVINSGKVVIANDAANDSRSAGVPPGHPSITSFLGVPIKHGNTVIGSIGLANRPGGYDSGLVGEIEPFVYTCSSILLALQTSSKFEAVRKKLQKSENEYQKLFENLQEGIWVIDKEAYTTIVNPRLAEMMGYTDDELIGMHLYDFMDECWVKMAKAFLARRRRGIVEQHEFDFVKKNGEKLHTLIETTPLTDENGNYTGALASLIDISKRKKAEEEVKAERFKLQEYFENIPILAYNVSFEGIIEDINNVAVKTLGYDDKSELIGKELIPTIYAPASQDKAKRLFEQWKYRKVLKNEELQIETKQGETIDVLLNADTIFDHNGAFVHSISTHLDITGLKLAEEMLRNNETLLEEILESIGDGFISLDENMSVIYYNSAAEKLLGRKRDQVLGKPLFEAFPEARGSIFEKEYTDALQKKIFKSFEAYFEVPPFQNWYDVRVYPRQNGISVYFQSIAERKIMENSLRKSEEKYRNIFENAVEGFFRSTPEGRFTEVNPAFAKMLGYGSPEELISSISDIRTQYYVDPEDRDRYRMLLHESGAVNYLEFKVKRKDGKEIWVSNSTRAYFDDDGNVTHYEGIIADVTERKNAEAERERLQSQLNQAMKMEAIGNLAGGIAHDFNNILASVIGFTEVALDEIDRGAHPEDSLQEVLKAGKRARDLVRQILLFSRQSDDEVKPIQPDVIAKEVLKFIRSSIPTTIEIEQQIACDSLIMGNPTHVYQMFMNLCTNAAQAMEDNGGKLSVKLRDAAIDDTATASRLGLKAGNYIEITVADSGPGIPPSIMDSIFDPYFTTKSPEKGTGMGLSVVKGIVENYGGKMTVDSRPGHGSTFTAYLPISKNKGAALLKTAPEKLPKGSERILFVDDESAIAGLGKQLLESLGYVVTTRTRSVEALELFRAKPAEFDMVVSDMTMPNMTGDELAVKLMKLRPEVPVILCTGYSRKISDEIAAEIGIKALIYKPIVKADLAKTVREVLDDAKFENIG